MILIPNSLALAIISQCEDLINQEENFLIGIFNKKLNSLSFLSEEEKISLKDENLNLINNDFINAYKYLKEALVLLKGKTTHNGALCNYPNGKEYYEARFRFNSGTDMTVLELEEYLKAKLNKLIAGYKASKEEYQEKFDDLYKKINAKDLSDGSFEVKISEEIKSNAFKLNEFIRTKITDMYKKPNIVFNIKKRINEIIDRMKNDDEIIKEMEDSDITSCQIFMKVKKKIKNFKMSLLRLYCRNYENALSIVFEASDRSIIMTGDIDIKTYRNVVYQQTSSKKYDIFKAPHHGSYYSTTFSRSDNILISNDKCGKYRGIDRSYINIDSRKICSNNNNCSHYITNKNVCYNKCICGFHSRIPIQR